jgi:hypothetical protein
MQMRVGSDAFGSAQRAGREEVLMEEYSGRAPANPAADPGAVVIVIHTLAHAVGALAAAWRAGRRVTLLSAPDAGIYAGPGWFGAVVEAARAVVPEVRSSAFLDCGDRPGAALAAIRDGIGGVIYAGPADVGTRLAAIARQHGVRLITERPVAALDLVDDFFASDAESKQRCAGVMGLNE